MKKLILALAFVSLAAVKANEYKYPGKSCRDIVELNKQLTLAEGNKLRIHDITVLLDFTQNGEPETIQEVSDRIQAVSQSVGLSFSEDALLDQVKIFAKEINIDRADFELFCKNNPSRIDLYYVLWKHIYMDDIELGFKILNECLLKYSYKTTTVTRAIDYLNKQSIPLGKTNEEMFEIFSNLNRIYSSKLIADKEKWAPVVAQIRTMIEVYK